MIKPVSIQAQRGEELTALSILEESPPVDGF